MAHALGLALLERALAHRVGSLQQGPNAMAERTLEQGESERMGN